MGHGVHGGGATPVRAAGRTVIRPVAVDQAAGRDTMPAISPGASGAIE